MYKCTYLWSRTGYQFGVYKNDSEHYYNSHYRNYTLWLLFRHLNT